MEGNNWSDQINGAFNLCRVDRASKSASAFSWKKWEDRDYDEGTLNFSCIYVMIFHIAEVDIWD